MSEKDLREAGFVIDIFGIQLVSYLLVHLPVY